MSVHELGLAQNVIEAVGADARRRGFRRVKRVTLRIGEWSAVLPESLEAGFAVLAALEGGLFAGTELLIEREPARGVCTVCGRSFPAGRSGLICPGCGGAGRLQSGVELEVKSYEGE